MHDEEASTTPGPESNQHVQRMSQIVARLVSTGQAFNRSSAEMEKNRAEMHAAMREARDAGLMYSTIIRMAESTQHHYTTAIKDRDSA